MNTTHNHTYPMLDVHCCVASFPGTPLQEPGNEATCRYNIHTSISFIPPLGLIGDLVGPY